MKSSVMRINEYLTALMLIFICARSADAAILFYDNFTGPVIGPAWTTALPDAWQRTPQTSGTATYIGAPGFVSFGVLDGASVLKLDDILNDASRDGWSSTAVIAPTKTPIICEVRFNTLTLGPTTSIDGFMELWLLDATDQTKYVKVSLVAPEYGSGRVFDAFSSVTNAHLDSVDAGSDFTFADNTWYRMVLTGSITQGLRAKISDDTEKILIGTELGHSLSAYSSGFRVGISQVMGAPGAFYPTNVAIDYVEVLTGAK